MPTNQAHCYSYLYSYNYTIHLLRLAIGGETKTLDPADAALVADVEHRTFELDSRPQDLSGSSFRKPRSAPTALYPAYSIVLGK